MTERVGRRSASCHRTFKRPRIALCHLESLVGLPALNAFFAELGDQIDLVIVSRRFGPKHGSVFRQLVNGVRRSGLRMTFWLGFDIISAQVASQVASLLNRLTGRAPALRSVGALAAQHGAGLVMCSDVNSPDTIQALRDAGIDLVVLMNFDQILRQDFIDTPKSGVVNLHPSLLPALRGPCPVFWALAQGDQMVGITLHIIESTQIDAGPIMEQVGMAVDPGLSVAEITSALFLKGARLVARAAHDIPEGRQSVVPQPPGQGEYRGFPDRAQMAAVARNVRLCRPGHLVALLAAACGLKSWTP
ncbi:MAG: hypothetical protein GEV13_34260 [Rhodospirillales bacterium]|nr:hypothetical protein [Rhodospirillales bacterium]